MRRSMVGGLAAALVALGLVGAPAAAGPPPKTPKGISHSVDAGTGSFNEESIANFGLNVTRSGLTRCASTVAWQIADATATNGSDFSVASSGTLTFAKNELSKSINVAMLDDENPEGPETFTFTLSSPTTSCKGGILSTLGTVSSATVTITDDDPTIFTVPAGGALSITNGSLGGCTDLDAKLQVASDYINLASDRNGCSDSVPVPNYTWNNTTGSAQIAKIAVVDFHCNFERYYSDRTGYDHGFGESTTINHALVVAKAGGGWDVDINDCNFAATWKVDSVPSAVNTGNLSLDVSITQPS